MLVKSIQDKEVLNKLLKNKIFYSNKTKKNLQYDLYVAYKIMSKYYNWKHLPIFGCEVGKYCDFYGAILKNPVILTLDVPDNIVKRQIYSDWTDMIYYIKYPNKLNNGMSINEFINYVLDNKNINFNKDIIQVTMPYINSKWLLYYNDLTEEFIKKYIKSSKANILK